MSTGLSDFDYRPSTRELSTYRVLVDDNWRLFRLIVDVAWNEATESTTVPSTDWADRIILRAIGESEKENT